MMLTILGLPPTTTYKDLKVLIKTRCNLSDFILDELVKDKGLKKVRIGLADNNEGSHLIKCLDGFRLNGFGLSVVPVGKSQAPPQNFDQRGNFNQPQDNYQQNFNDRPRWEPNMPSGQLTSPQWAPNPINQGPGPNSFGFQQGPQNNMQYMPPQQHQNVMQQNQYHHNQGQFGQHNQNMGPGQHANQHSNQHNQGPHGMVQSRPDMKPFGRDQFNRPDQGFGGPRNNAPEPAPSGRSHVLRTVEIVDTSMNRPGVQPNRVPAQNYPPQNKPMTAMKDNFQRPGPYSPTQAAGPPQGAQPWAQQQQKPAPFTKPPGPYDKPFDRPGKPQEPDRDYKPYDKEYGRPKSPPRKPSPRRSPGRRHSPGRMSPRRHSPGRRPSPGRRSPPVGRRMSPGRGSPGRRMSPGRGSPGRRMSPGRRSPGRRMSPGRREPLRDDRRSPGRMGPGMEASRPAWSARRISPDTHKRSPDRDPSARYSPTRRVLDKHDDFRDNHSLPHGKTIRPAYEPTVQDDMGEYSEKLHQEMTSTSTYGDKTAPNQAMYTGGYRPNSEKDSYPKPVPRPVEPPSPWQQNRDKPMRPDMLKRDDERIPPRMPFDRPGIRMDKDRKRSHSPRKSRSPVRKSPSKDRFKRHSPSPRSPRRSWALEKRRSPEDREAPPPPLWPGQPPTEDTRPDFTPEDAKRRPVWEYNKKSLDVRRPDEVRRFPPQDTIRVRTDLGSRPERREELDFKRDDRFGRDGPKFSPREDFDKKVPKFSPRDDFEKKPKFSPRDDFDKAPKFSPRDDFDKAPKFSPRDDFDKTPKFSPRDNFDDKRSKFLPFDDKTPKFGPREVFTKPTVFNPRDEYEEPNRDDIRKDPKYSRDFDRPKFSPRDDFSDHRDDFRRHEEVRKPWEDAPPKLTERDDYRRDAVKLPETARMDLHRDVFQKMSEELDKDFEDVHMRAKEFQRRVEETRRDDRRRDYDRREPESKPYEDRPKSRDDDQFRFEPRRKEDWNTQEHLKTKAIKAKKDKAVDEITQKILDKHNIDAEAEQNTRICQELSLSVNKIINNMFGDSDVSFIELIVKFNAKYSGAGEDKILRDVMASFPSQFRPKRTASDYPEVSAKSAKRFSEPAANQGVSQTKPTKTTHVPEWDMTREPHAAPNTVAPSPVAPPVGYYPPPMMQPMMVGPMMMPGSIFPPPFSEGPSFQERSQFQEALQYQDAHSEPQADDNNNLYLCKDDFQPFMEREAMLLKTYLIQHIVKESESGRGWAPDFTFKGLHSSLRYELQTRDEQSRQWLFNHDFSASSFKYNILVYTSEELWYERAAIWLPGHSRCRNIEPLDKLKLQNKHLQGAQVGKWKLVKKIVNPKGTRVYVDMPPSAARALEKHKMSLSYELQKVSVFLKAVAIDKDAFDLGLKDYTITDETEIKTAINNNPMPMLAPDPKIVKIALPGNKPMTILQARKIREMLIFQIFKYHKEDGASKTDFIKHGFISPRHFGILPGNTESQRWLMKLDNWKLKRHPLVVVGADENTTRYIPMFINLPECENRVNAPMVIEKLKQSNRGVKGIDVTKWKVLKLTKEFHNNIVFARFEVDIDVESVETIIKMDYKLDYVDEKNPTQVVQIKYGRSEKQLLDLVKKLKSELHDTYDDTDMDLASDSDMSSDEESVICLDNE